MRYQAHKQISKAAKKVYIGKTTEAIPSAYFT